jgi:hypothetical protein
MRARLTWNTAPTACGTHTYGEVEDYTVNVLADGPDWITLDGGSMVSNSIPVGAGDDVITVGFDATGLTDGVYTADIVITSNDHDESPFNIPVTLTVAGPPDAPINVQIEINDTNVTISWDPVTGANSYKIYSAFSTEGTFTLLETVSSSINTRSYIVVEPKRFFRIVASTDEYTE